MSVLLDMRRLDINSRCKNDGFAVMAEDEATSGTFLVQQHQHNMLLQKQNGQIWRSLHRLLLQVTLQREYEQHSATVIYPSILITCLMTHGWCFL